MEASCNWENGALSVRRLKAPAQSHQALLRPCPWDAATWNLHSITCCPTRKLDPAGISSLPYPDLFQLFWLPWLILGLPHRPLLESQGSSSLTHLLRLCAQQHSPACDLTSVYFCHLLTIAHCLYSV